MKEFVLKNDFDPARCKIEYQKELNAEQLDVVLHGDGACLVLAGAGSGKTRTITYRVAYLIENGIAPDNILLVTFTNKAAREMLSRLEGLLGTYPKGIWGGTFHAMGNRVLRTYASAVGRTSNFTILDEEDARDLIKICVKDLAIDTGARRFPSPANIHAAASFARNASVSLSAAVEKLHPHFFELLPVIERVVELYENRKRQADAMDFDDLLILLRDLLRDRPDVRDRLASQFRYVLVDEYQDTNAVQAEVVRALSSVHQNILVVGDDAQSIYAFRGADVRNILSFPDLHPGASVFRLVTNYRSTPQILDLANAVIKNNKHQFSKDLRAVRDPLDLPNVVPAGNAAQEAQYIAAQILALHEEGTKLNDMAVLFRAAYLSQALEFEMMRRDIPYEYRGGMKFFQRAHVKDVVAHLRLLQNGRDELAWMRILSLQPGIGLATVGVIVDKIRVHPTLEAALAADLALPARAKRGWEHVRDLLKVLLGKGGGPAGAIRSVAGSGGYREYLEAEYPDHADRMEDLEQFAIFAETYDDLTKFLEDVSLVDDYGAVREAGKTQEDRVVLSTIHQAKGLEWDAVFVMGLTHGKFPSERALAEDGGLEEERRLFYVAATRARKQLFLTYPIMAGHDAFMIGQPSQFIEEVPEGLLEEVRLKTQVAGSRGQLAGDRRSTRGSATEDWETTIVLDELGEESGGAGSASGGRPSAGSFLRNVDEL